jgi:hypothetical protein
MLWLAEQRLGRMRVIRWNQANKNKPTTKQYEKSATRLLASSGFFII